MPTYWLHLPLNLFRSLPAARARLLFPLGAVLIGLLPLVVTEVVLRACQVGFVSDADDPYIGFDHIRPLFRLNPQTNRYEIGPERQTFFRPDGFPAEKPKNGFRIFCLGGSTVQGRPYAIETSFGTWLELNLQAADPSRQWDVVNCGGVSYASYRLAPILHEVLDYQPDLIILCTGHNEFLEDRTYGPIKQSPRWLSRTHGLLSQLHTYNTLRSILLQRRGTADAVAQANRARLPEEVDALLDYRGGLDDYQRDETWRQGTIAHFQLNVQRMVSICQQRSVPILLINPPYNLKDTPPFKYEHRAGITPQEETRFEQIWDQAKQEGISTAQRIELLQQALAIDPQHAAAQFHLGRCYLSERNSDQARQHLTRAKDEDICPLRILSPMRQIIADVATDHSVPLLDAQQLFEQQSRDSITGNDWFLDHVHPSIRGHQLWARTLFEQIVQQLDLQPTPGWQQRRDTAFLQHLQSLDNMYYIRGQQRLAGLTLWTQGRASLIKGAPRRPQTLLNRSHPL